MSILGFTRESLIGVGGIYTATEISGQPELWLRIYDKIDNEKDRLKEYLGEVLPKVSKIILTGAGSSAFIGLSLRGVWNRKLRIFTEEVATTDLVSHPLDYLPSDGSILLVSFARSGNSPESIAAVNLAEKICKSCYHLIITCDANGELANHESQSLKYVFLLPPESNDQSLAMTGSYSGMLLAGLLIACLSELDELHAQVEQISAYGRKILDEYSSALQKVAGKNFRRAVFLGSGPLFGTATESHLKLQELTDGEVICKNDSYLGFRHGPKAVIDEKTLVVFILSNNPYVLKYEADLVKSMEKGKKALYTIGIFECPVQDLHFDLNIQLSAKGNHVLEELLTVCDVLPAQMLGLFRSINLGLKPDAPSVSGAISRIVEGVKIYNY